MNESHVVSVILLLTLKDIYDTQQDRILFQKTHETVLECRKTASVSFAQQGVKGQPPRRSLRDCARLC